MKNKISIWFNRYGVDECLVKGEGEFNLEFLNELGNKVNWLGGWNKEMWEGLYEEEKGKGWVMYGFDGIGVMVVEEGFDEKVCKDEYDGKFI